MTSHLLRSTLPLPVSSYFSLCISSDIICSKLGNRPLTVTHLPLHPDAANMFQHLAVANEKLENRIEELEYSRNQHIPQQQQQSHVYHHHPPLPHLSLPSYSMAPPQVVVQPPQVLLRISPTLLPLIWRVSY